MSRYCVGTAMAIDWDQDAPAQIDRHLIARAFGYFRPYWRRGLLSVAAISAGAVLALAPAFLSKKLIDHLSAQDARFSYIALLVIAGLVASIVSGLVGVADAYVSTSISQGIMSDLRWQLYDRLLGHSVGFFTRSRTGDVISTCRRRSATRPTRGRSAGCAARSHSKTSRSTTTAPPGRPWMGSRSRSSPASSSPSSARAAPARPRPATSCPASTTPPPGV
jgi:hypothetical protein